MRAASFPPVIGRKPRILILGSMPGEESLRQGQYYAHPRNQFWMIMGALIGAGPELPYADRLARLKESGIALWDSLKLCERTGSLDSSIRPESEIANEVACLLAEYPSIRIVCFNGQKAAAAFRKHILSELSQARRDEIEWITLPSTSPANAARSRNQKLEQWRLALAPHLTAWKQLMVGTNADAGGQKQQQTQPGKPDEAK